MFLQHSLLFLIVVTAFLLSTKAQTCNLIGPAIIKGKKFFDSRSGNYIPLKGIAYYPRPNEGELSEGNNLDFFSEEHRHIWERDIQYFQQLGINVVRIYAVNPGLDHSGFMCALKEAGIYVIVELAADCQDCAITGQQAPTCYAGALKERGQFIINVFSKYENVLAFSAGNEAHLFITTGNGPENNGPCQKQFLRDMRAYIESCPNLRKIPVGLAVADFSREENALYYNCRSDSTDELENAEWYGLNVYLHCDPSAQTIADLEGFNGLLEDHKSFGMTIPVVLTEYGCENANFPTIDGFEGQRNWLQVDALYSDDFQDWFAGGTVFEYSTERPRVESESNFPPFPYEQHAQSNWGLGYFAPVDCDDIYIPCVYTPYPEFDILASKFAAVDASGEANVDSYTPESLDIPTCPSSFLPLSSFTWESETVEDLECVGPDYVFICPNTAPECLPPFAVTAPATPPPSTVAPSTLSPSTVTNEPTISPTTASTNDTPVPSEAPDDTATSPVLQESPTPMKTTVEPSDSMGTTPEPTLSLALPPVAFQPTRMIFAATSSARVPYSLTWLWSSACVALLCLGYRA